MTFDPVYYGSIPENLNDKGLFVTQIQAYDLDKNLNQTLTYEITRYDPLNFFKIDKYTGKTNCLTIKPPLLFSKFFADK